MAATKLGRLAIIAVSVLAASVATDIGSASAQLEAPRVGVPQVEVPSVPPVPVAPVAPPSLPSPPAVPPVDVPDVRAPSVPVPGVQAPSVPGGTAPGGVAAPGSGGSAGTPAAPSSGSSTSQGSSPRGSGDGRPARPLREAGAAAAGRRPASPPISSRSERGLRREVRRLSDCAATLPALERRVLDLRAGLDGATPSPRRTVARRLDMPLAQVRRAERDGLATLRRTDRASGCAAGGSSTLRISWMSLMASVGVAPQLTTMASLQDSATTTADADAAGRDRAAVRGDRASSDEETTVAEAPHAEPDATTRPTAASIGDGSGRPLLTWLMLLVLVLAATAASPALLRRRRGASAAGPAETDSATPQLETTQPPEAAVEASAPFVERPTPPAPPSKAPAVTPHHDASNPVEPHHASGRTVGVVISSAMSLAVGVAMWARRRSGARRRWRR